MRSELEKVNEVDIPIFDGADIIEIKTEIHLFADASCEAYEAVANLWIVIEEVNNVSLIKGKSKLARLQTKRVSLELQAAVIAARLKVKLITKCNFDVSKIYIWRDTTVFIKYIYNEDRCFSTYVMYRIVEIRENTNKSDWRNVLETLNAADAIALDHYR